MYVNKKGGSICTGKLVCGRCLQVQIYWDLPLLRDMLLADDKYLESQLRLFSGITTQSLNMHQHCLNTAILCRTVRRTRELPRATLMLAGSIEPQWGMRVMVITIVFPGITETIFWSAPQKRRPYAKRRTMDICKCRGGLLFDPQQALRWLLSLHPRLSHAQQHAHRVAARTQCTKEQDLF
jgi:hypothetical protein